LVYTAAQFCFPPILSEESLGPSCANEKFFRGSVKVNAPSRNQSNINYYSMLTATFGWLFALGFWLVLRWCYKCEGQPSVRDLLQS
jgi:hypothetical protein